VTPDFLERNIFWYTGQLILSRIIKIVATSRRIFAPNSLGELTAVPRPRSWI